MRKLTVFRHSWVSWPLAVLLQGAEIDEVSMRLVKLLSVKVDRIYVQFDLVKLSALVFTDSGTGTQPSHSPHTMLHLPHHLHHPQEQIVSSWKLGTRKLKTKSNLKFEAICNKTIESWCWLKYMSCFLCVAKIQFNFEIDLIIWIWLTQ